MVLTEKAGDNKYVFCMITNTRKTVKAAPHKEMEYWRYDQAPRTIVNEDRINLVFT